MLLPSDLEPILGRIPGLQMSVDLERWSRQGWASGLRVPGSLDVGVCTEAGLSSTIDSPGSRWRRVFRAPQPFLLDATLLAGVLASVGGAAGSLQRFVAPLNLQLHRHGIDSIARMAAFLGQVGIESQGLTRMEENLRYRSAERLIAVFGQNVFGETDAADYVGEPEALANRVYASKGGNGAVASGDGWRYRGRGLIQLTLKDNYSAFAKASGIDAVGNPDLLLQPAGAVAAACWYWRANGLNELADTDKLGELTRRINRKQLEREKREALTVDARAALRQAWQAW